MVIPIKVHRPVRAIFSATPSSACVGTAITFQNTSWGDSLTFIWDMGDGSPLLYDTALAAATQMPRSHTHTYTTPGTYTVTLYVKGYCGKDTLRRTITIYPYPTASFNVDATEKCQGNATFTFTNTSTAGGTYSWSFPGGTPSSSTAYNPPPVTYSTPGPKTVTLIVTRNGCTSTTSQTINVAPLPTISFSVLPTSGCPPLAVTITQSSPNLPGYTYIWDYGNGVRDTNYTPTSPIIYNNTSTTSSQTYTIKLIVITDKGCKDSLQRTITVRPRVIAGFTAPALVCEGVPVTFTNTSSGANSYQWNFGDGSPINTATSPTYTYSTPGTYTVQLIAINTTTGCRDTFQQPINVNPIPNPTFTRAPAGGCVPLTVNLTNTTPFDPTYLYIWDYGNGQRDTSYTPNNPTYTSAGTYTVGLEVVTPAGCRRTTTASVTVSPLPTANFSAPASACVQAPVTFTNASTGATSYQWDFGDGVGTSTATNPTYAYTTAGTFTVTLIATSGVGCRDTFTRPITIYPRPTADFSYTIECLGSPTSFTDNSIGAVSYQWNFGDGSPVSTLPNPTHTYAAAGTYTVQLIVTSADGCKDTVTKSVPVNATPNPDFSFTTACLGQATSFTDLTPGTPTGWEWDFGDGSLRSTLQNPTHTYAVPGTYSVKLIVQGGTGCVDSITKSVTVHPVPTAGFTATTACAVDEAVTFTNTSSGAVAYQWNFGDGSPISTAPNPTHVYARGGTYAVQLIVSNGPGCRDTFTQNVLVYPKPTITFSHNTVCLGGTTSFTAPSDVTIGSYSWNFAMGRRRPVVAP
jgi:PKD repeat protein